LLFNRHYLAAAQKSGPAVPLVIGLEREGGFISRYETMVKSEADPDTLRYVERIVKNLLWVRGGWKIYFGGHSKLANTSTAATYTPSSVCRLCFFFDSGAFLKVSSNARYSAASVGPKSP